MAPHGTVIQAVFCMRKQRKHCECPVRKSGTKQEPSRNQVEFESIKRNAHRKKVAPSRNQVEPSRNQVEFERVSSETRMLPSRNQLEPSRNQVEFERVSSEMRIARKWCQVGTKWNQAGTKWILRESQAKCAFGATPRSAIIIL